MDPGVIATYAADIPITRALILSSLAAILVAAGAAVTATVGVSAIWLAVAIVVACLPQLAGHGASLGDHSLAVAAGIAHVVAATLWVGGLVALIAHAIRRTSDLSVEVRRFGYLAVTCVVLLAASGLANAYTRLDSAAQLVTTGYGQVVLGKAVLLALLVAAATVMRRRIAPTLADPRAPGVVRRFALIAGTELVVMVAAVAAGTALSLSPTPRIEGLLPTPGENLLGFAYPPPPTAATVILGFRLEPVFLVGSLVAAALYCAGVARLRFRGDAWSAGRTISWLVGIGTIIWATNAGIASYAQVSVGLHMVQHMTLSMVSPMLLVLGAPFTLALRAITPSPGAHRGPREWIVWLLHSPYVKVLTNPITVFLLYAIGLYGLYFTSAFGWLMGNHIGHLWMQFHFIAVGYLFAWMIMGIDPLPYRLPYWARFAVLLVAIAIHAFFAVALMSGGTVIGQEWYSQVRPPWIPSASADTNVGGQIAWGISEIPMLFMLIVIGAQWAGSDAREARRTDRQADRDGDAELNAYNDYLRALEDRSRR